MENRNELINRIEKKIKVNIDEYIEWLKESGEEPKFEGLLSLAEEQNNIKPKHYELMGVEVKDILEEVLKNVEQSDFKMTLNEAGWYQQMMQYLLRFYGKNGLEDLKKGREALNILIKSIEEHES